MSSSPSPLLKLELQASGEHDDTWGDNLNATLVLIENAIAKRADISTTGGTTTLSDTQYADNQARCSALDFSGTLASNAVIVVPTRAKSWIVRNGCTGSFSLTVKTSAGSGVVVSQGQTAILWCDGTNVVSVSGDAATLGGLAASAFARKDAANVFAAGEAYTPFALTDGATITMDVSAHKVFRVTLGDNRTLAISNATDGASFELYVTQDGTGSRTLTFPSNFVAASSLVLSSAANAVDKLVGRYIDALGVWYVELARGIQSGGGSTIADITIEGGNINVDAYALAGSPSGAVTFTFTVDDGASIASLTPASPALDFSGFASGSQITINIRGVVHGAGGKGGRGAFAGDVSSANLYGDGTAGNNGGTAIRLPSTSGNTIVVNIGDNGRVWGGGGGGGGGGASHDGDGSSVGCAGGGGGGGAGGGGPGDGGSIVSANGAPGNPGSVGRLGGGGTGGSGQDTGGTGDAGAGGAGGNFGSNGSSGATPTSHTMNGAAGTGGTAGKAIDYNGGSTPSYTGNTGSPYILGATS